MPRRCCRAHSPVGRAGGGDTGYHRPVLRIGLVLSFLLAASDAGAEELVVGSQAPGFALPGSDGRIHSLAEHAGKRGVVLAWFPKAFTPG
jgi:peroxiredoxin Q/BCP